jgi:hypothetical protein
MKNTHVSVLLLVSAFLFISFSTKGQSLIINEFQTLNNTIIADEDTTYSDWIELYNSGTLPMNLEGWSLTDKAKEPKKWIFPAVQLNAGAYLLVFTSNKDRKVVGQPLHTNFKLSGDEGYLGLFNPSGVAVSELNPYPALPNDYSLGWFNGDWLIYSTPTPGLPNNSGQIASYPKPVFSKNHGFCEQAFQLGMTCSLPNARIIYTLDGSVPSAANGMVYTKPLSIEHTSIVRAIALSGPTDASGIAESVVNTGTYLFIEDILKQSNTPAGYPAKWGKYESLPDSAIADYEMDTEIVSVQANADKIRQSFKELPVVSIVTDKNNLFNKTNNATTGGIYIYTGYSIGDGWERPASFEYFDYSHPVSLQANCGIELHGSASRMAEKSPKHSLKVAFKSKYGPTKLMYPLFGETEAQQQNAFYLRSGFGFSWVHWDNSNRTKAIYSRDEWAKRTQTKMGDRGGNTQHAHLFINGMYWGLYNPTEKIDDDFCETYFGGDKTEWDVVRVEEMNTLWKNLCTMATASTDTVYQRIQGCNPDGTPNPAYEPLLDMENFIDYMILNFYGGNDDWDHHNWYAARNRVNPGKGFQFFCWDSESLLLSTTSNLINEYNKNCPSDLFQSLRKVPAFCRLWGDRMQKHCFNNGALTPTIAAETFTQLITPIENSLYAESARWGDYRRDVHPYSSAGDLYRKDVQFDAQKKVMLETYFPQRTNNFVTYMKNAGLYPTISAPNLFLNGQAIKKDTFQQGDKLTMTITAGKIYYTIDLTDPVKWSATGSGSTSASAKQYGTTILPDQSVRIKARAVSNGVWSALVDQNLVKWTSVGLDQPVGYYNQIQLANAPNPFVESTTFRYSLPFEGLVNLTIVDLSGRTLETIVNEKLEAGDHETSFDGSRLQPGIYLCKLDIATNAGRQSKVLRLVKM